MSIITDDLHLKLLSKRPILIGKIPIYPVSIDDISMLGYENYSHKLSFICMEKNWVLSQVKQITDDENVITLEVFDFIFSILQQDTKLREEITNLFSLIFRSKVEFIDELQLIKVNDAYINNMNFPEIQDVIRKRNNILSHTEIDDNPENDKARQLLEKRKKNREKLNHVRSKDSNGLNLGDLVSIFAGGMKLPIETVMEYDLYQFNDQFSRLSIMKDYDVNIEALIHGAKSEDVKLEHWMRKINKEDK